MIPSYLLLFLCKGGSLLGRLPTRSPRRLIASLGEKNTHLISFLDSIVPKLATQSRLVVRAVLVHSVDGEGSRMFTRKIPFFSWRADGTQKRWVKSASNRDRENARTNLEIDTETYYTPTDRPYGVGTG